MENVDFHSRTATDSDRKRQHVDTEVHGVTTSDYTRQEAPEKRVLMTTQELATFLRCSKRHVQRLRKAGLPDIKVGELVRFSEKDVLDWLDRQRPDFRGYSWCALPEP